MSARRALLGVAFAAFAIRLAALFVHGGPLAAPTGYDDGVYFSSSALWLRGLLPYRDFVLVHPPGILWVFALTSWLPDPGVAFAAARVLACIAGGVSTLLIGCIVTRAAGPLGGIAAAALYALYPDAVTAERSAYLEPFLNLAVLSSMFARERRPFLSGVLCGAACAIKFWGGIWVIAALFKRERLRFLAGACIAGLVLLAPIAFPALNEFITQTLRFQLSRPPDGTLDLLTRAREMFFSGHAATSLLALMGIWKSRDRVFAIAMLLTIAGFFASSSYWVHYNSHLAVSQCVLAGLAVAALGMRRSMVLALLLLVFDARTILRTLRPHPSAEMVAAAKTPGTFFAFDPSWSLAAHHLPVIPDTYATMLLPQPDIRARLASSNSVLLGWRGIWQLSASDRAWFAAHFECTNPDAGNMCLWKRRATPRASSIEDQFIRFGEGWYDLEGDPPNTWRWMSRRSLMALPAREGVLHLEFDHPELLTIELDGRVVRGLDVPVSGDAPHTLTITSARVFVPARERRWSRDTRELSVRLTRFAWRDRAASTGSGSP
ncbi:MAG TPA: glycosyltransferase family 39 protein [Thermoanaerobaculia bacterium]|nr:glycosyltransferase family 39 protein [Thermoanaerobaculia bacterium]